MYYFEEAIVKTYYRNYKNKKVAFNQLNLGTESKFNEDPEKPDKVGVIYIEELKDLLNKVNGTAFKELEDNYNKLHEEKLQLEQELQELKTTTEKLTSDVEKLKEEKFNLQEELLKAEDKNEEIIQLQQKHKEEVAELNFKLNNEKDYSKALLVVINDLFKRNGYHRLKNSEPESYKRVVKLKQIPENEVKTKTSEE